MIVTDTLEMERNRIERLLAMPVRNLEDLAIQRVLAQVSYQQRNALSAMRQGQYGVCARCGNPIERGRLEVLPTATTCAACAHSTRR